MGNVRHCGLYLKGQLSPFPIPAAQQAMEEKLHSRLGLKPGSKLLDAGAGSGYVAMTMARHGHRVHAFDIIQHHVREARDNVQKHGLESMVSVGWGDYHDLSALEDGSFDGIYTMETFAHADDALKVLSGFMRLLKPGGVLVLHESYFNRESKPLQRVMRLLHIEKLFAQGSYEELLRKAGFRSIDVVDLSDRVLPTYRLLGVMNYVPYQVFKLFGVQERFINIMAMVEIWLNHADTRYLSIRAVKA